MQFKEMLKLLDFALEFSKHFKISTKKEPVLTKIDVCINIYTVASLLPFLSFKV